MTRPPLDALTGGGRDLAGAIGAPPPTIAPAAGKAPEEAVPAPTPTTPERPPAPTRKSAAANDDKTKQAVPIYLPAALLARLRTATTTTGESYSDWVLDAYEIVHDQLGERFAPVPMRRSGLPPRKRAPRRHVENPVAVQLRFTGGELRVLEQKRDAVGGPSRSAFYTAIVEMRFEAERAPTAGSTDPSPEA